MTDKEKKKSANNSEETKEVDGGVLDPVSVVADGVRPRQVTARVVAPSISGPQIILPNVAPLPKVAPQSMADAIFGKQEATLSAEEVLNQKFSDMLNARKQAAEGAKTDATRMARLSALGNVLTTMVQPIGWAIGGRGTGVTGGVQPVDNRQYLQAFERAQKANDDLRNIGTMEGEYQFNLANEAYRRAQAMEDYENKARIELEKQKQIFDMRSQLSQQQMEERIKVAEATAKAKFRFGTKNGGRVAESVRDNLLKRANTAYAQILADYYKKKQVGIENLQEPPSYDEFLKKFASENGYPVADSQESPATTPSGKKPNPMGGTTSNSTSGKKPNPMS